MSKVRATEPDDEVATVSRPEASRGNTLLRAQWSRILPALGLGLAVAGVWEVVTRLRGTFATPPLSEIVVAFVGLPFEPDFWPALVTTLQALVVGYALSVAVGLPIGVLVGRVRPLERIISVYLTIALSVPLAATVPVVIILFGIGLPARVAVVVLFTLPMLTVNVITGAANVRRSLLEMAASFNCRGVRLARRVIIPAALPEIFAGLRLGAGRAVIGMVVAELIIIAAGVGRLIDVYSSQYRMDYAFALVLAILVISAVFVHSITFVEGRVLRWQRE